LGGKPTKSANLSLDRHIFDGVSIPRRICVDTYADACLLSHSLKEKAWMRVDIKCDFILLYSILSATTPALLYLLHRAVVHQERE
jgi:hypothetical protein